MVSLHRFIASSLYSRSDLPLHEDAAPMSDPSPIASSQLILNTPVSCTKQEEIVSSVDLKQLSRNEMLPNQRGVLPLTLPQYLPPQPQCPPPAVYPLNLGYYTHEDMSARGMDMSAYYGMVFDNWMSKLSLKKLMRN